MLHLGHRNERFLPANVTFWGANVTLGGPNVTFVDANVTLAGTARRSNSETKSAEWQTVTVMRSMIIKIRHIRPEDYFSVSRIFFCAVHEGTSHAYSLAERRAWGGDTIDLPRWKDRLITLTGFIAEVGGEPVGFITVDQMGYIDLAFVLPSAAGKGIGSAILGRAEHLAMTQGATCLTTAASLAARPFFQKHGWVALKEEQVERGGVTLKRYQMQKHLAKSDC